MIFRTPTARQIARRQLAEAQRQLLTAHDNLEQSQANVERYTAAVKRLEAYLWEGPLDPRETVCTTRILDKPTDVLVV